MAKALLVTTDNRFIPIDDLKSSEIAERIGARVFDMVTGVSVPGVFEDCAMFVDDEGLLLDEPKVNVFGSIISQRLIAGDVIVVGDENQDGNLTDMPQSALSPEFAEEFHLFLIQNPGIHGMLTQRLATVDLTPKVYSMDDWMAMMKADQN